MASREKAEEYLEKLRRTLEKAEGLDKVFDKRLIRDEFIVFCADVEHMAAMVKKAPECFSGVDMFNEDIHVGDIDGVKLFRPTVSPIVYKQQIDRALCTMKGGAPLIIDEVRDCRQLINRLEETLSLS